jgi:hypothetical protein
VEVVTSNFKTTIAPGDIRTLDTVRTIDGSLRLKNYRWRSPLKKLLMALSTSKLVKAFARR